METIEGRLRTCRDRMINEVEDVVFDSEANILATTRTREGGRALQRLHLKQTPRCRTDLPPRCADDAGLAFVSAAPRFTATVTRVKQLPDETALIGYSKLRATGEPDELAMGANSSG